MEVEVETRALKGDYEEFVQTIGKSRNDFMKVSETMTSLSTMWKGTASMAFAARIRTDTVEMQKMLNELEEMANALSECGIAYESNEWKAKELIESVKW